MAINVRIRKLLFIVAWCVYRPPLRPLAVASGLIAILAIWSPYLSFERNRDFIDLRSQLLSQSLLPRQTEELAAYGQELGSWDEAQGKLVDYRPHGETSAGQAKALGHALMRARATPLSRNRFFSLSESMRCNAGLLGKFVQCSTKTAPIFN